MNDITGIVVQNILQEKLNKYQIYYNSSYQYGDYDMSDYYAARIKELKIKHTWQGKGIKEKCFDENMNVIVECNKAYFRPLEVDTLLGDAKKARRELNWKPEIKINELVKEMVVSELKLLKND